MRLIDLIEMYPLIVSPPSYDISCSVEAHDSAATDETMAITANDLIIVSLSAALLAFE